MGFNKLSELNDIYNFQDTIILCKIFESRAIKMIQKFPYNLDQFIQKVYSQIFSKAIIALPTRAEIVDLFQQTIIGILSCVNTRSGFDSKLFLPKNSDGKPKENLKIIYNIGNEDKTVVSKILKMNENNQYRNAMTKPLPTVSIKREKIPTTREFDLTIQSISDEDKIGLFVVDVHFDQKNVSEKQLFFNETYSPIFKRKKFCQQMKDLLFNYLML